MVGQALHDHLTVHNTDDSFHDADLDMLLLEQRALLDVQFDVRANAAWPAFRFPDLVGVAAEKLDAVPNALAALRYGIEARGVESATEGGASQQSAFFVLENDDL